jgi:predicted amidohydrolase YtcJ
MNNSLLFRNVEVRHRAVDVLVADGHVVAIGEGLSARAEVVDGRGGALLPGLHDHHVHLLAMAAARQSIDVSQLDRQGFVDALRAADHANPRSTWLRVIGYHESAIGLVDRETLDEILVDRPVRVQHATGAMWVCNTAGLDAARLADAPQEGVERDASGVMTGRLFGLDDWFARILPRDALDVAAVGRELTRFGITGVTDMTPYRDVHDLDALRDGVETRALMQRVTVSGAPTLDRADLAPLQPGPAKIIVNDARPPDPELLARDIAAAHTQQLPVALHCASRLGVVLALAALEQAGAGQGDRMEHGAVIPPELFARLRATGVTVVTQPAFVYARGDRYLADVETVDVPHLWRCRSLLDHGIAVGFGSDAPYGPPDPWLAIQAATTRRTRADRLLGSEERLSPKDALERFLAASNNPGGRPRCIERGTSADLCLLHVPLAVAVLSPSAEVVRATIIDGEVVGT